MSHRLRSPSRRPGDLSQCSAFVLSMCSSCSSLGRPQFHLVTWTPTRMFSLDPSSRRHAIVPTPRCRLWSSPLRNTLRPLGHRRSHWTHRCQLVRWTPNLDSDPNVLIQHPISTTTIQCPTQSRDSWHAIQLSADPFQRRATMVVIGSCRTANMSHCCPVPSNPFRYDISRVVPERTAATTPSHLPPSFTPTALP